MVEPEDYKELVELEALIKDILERYDNTESVSREVKRGMYTLAGDLIYQKRILDKLQGHQEDIYYARAKDLSPESEQRSVRPLSPSEMKKSLSRQVADNYYKRAPF